MAAFEPIWNIGVFSTKGLLYKVDVSSFHLPHTRITNFWTKSVTFSVFLCGHKARVGNFLIAGSPVSPHLPHNSSKVRANKGFLRDLSQRKEPLGLSNGEIKIQVYGWCKFGSTFLTSFFGKTRPFWKGGSVIFACSIAILRLIKKVLKQIIRHFSRPWRGFMKKAYKTEFLGVTVIFQKFSCVKKCRKLQGFSTVCLGWQNASILKGRCCYFSVRPTKYSNKKFGIFKRREASF